MPSKVNGDSGGHVCAEMIDFNSDRKEGVTQAELHKDIDEEVYFLETLRSGAGSTGWLEREAAGNSERTSGHLGSRDVRSHKRSVHQFYHLS